MVIKGTFLRNYFNVHEKSFKGFFSFGSSCQTVRWSGTVRAILVEGHTRNISGNNFKINAVVHKVQEVI